MYDCSSLFIASCMGIYGIGVQFYFSYGGGGLDDQIITCRSKALILQPSGLMTFSFSVYWAHSIICSYGEEPVVKLSIEVRFWLTFMFLPEKPGLHMVVTIAEYVCDDASKWILKQ